MSRLSDPFSVCQLCSEPSFHINSFDYFIPLDEPPQRHGRVIIARGLNEELLIAVKARTSKVWITLP